MHPITWNAKSGRVVVSVALLLGCRLAASGVEITPQSPVKRDSLITVKHDGSAFVIGLVNGKFAPVTTHDCPGALIFTGPPGSYLVIVVEAQQRFQGVVEIVDKPEPGPGPGPNPPPPPPPDPVVPDSVLRAYGIGPAAYLTAKKANLPAAEIQRLNAAYARAAQLLHEQRATPSGIQAQLRDIRGQLSAGWATWEREIEARLTEAITRHGSGQFVWRDYCREIASALQAAAGPPSPTKATPNQILGMTK